MSGPLGSQQWMYSTGFYPYEIDQSLRFNDDDTAYLNRTPASAGNRKTWTWSGWVKRSALNGSTYVLFQQRLDSNGSQQFTIQFRGENLLRVLDQDGGGNQLLLDTTALYRDTSAWYHIVVAVDTTLSTSADRAKLYVNGERITSFSSPIYYSTQDYQTSVNNTVRALIGVNRPNASSTLNNYFDGYLAEVNFIDGQAQDATSFGEFKSGVWIPKSYSGSYGTNGFYLDFGNSGSLGADSSGNGNNWTPNNLAATDQVLDSPTNNFATLNPLDKTTSNASLSEGNLRYVNAVADTNWYATFGSVGMTSGKYYWEQCVTSLTTSLSAGVVVGNHSSYNGYNYPFGPETYKVYQNGSIYHDGSTTAYSSTFTTGDVVGVCVDADAREVWISINGVFQGSPTAGTGGMAATVGDPFPEGAIFPMSDVRTATGIFNFGQDSSFAGTKTAQGNTDANGIGDFYYAPPAGYLALCTANLPDPVIDPAQDDVPADYFNTVLWTGDGSTDRDITGVGFQPDWVWYKKRSAAFDHNLFDAVRGAGKLLESSTTAAESTTSDRLNGFISDGFNVGNNSGVNASSATYVAWNWLAGNGTSTNTDGTITSTVSANEKAGFSIVGYTGNGSNATVGHGLSSTPEMIIFKNRTSSGNSWVVYSSELGATKYLLLNSTVAAGTYNHFQNTTPTSSVAYITGGATAVNANTNNYIAYCFHSVEGFSKFGSYTGNGSTDGPFVYTGFRPAFVMIKVVNLDGGHWVIHDSGRDEFNESQKWLFPSGSSAEQTATYSKIDLLANGFKIKSAPPDNVNYSGYNFIYMAFAEMPFKYSLGR